jgi:hypothetical protein
VPHGSVQLELTHVSFWEVASQGGLVVEERGAFRETLSPVDSAGKEAITGLDLDLHPNFWGYGGTPWTDNLTAALMVRTVSAKVSANGTGEARCGYAKGLHYHGLSGSIDSGGVVR